MDTPYRLSALLRDLADTFGNSRRCCIAFNLTMPDEQIMHGTPRSLLESLSGKERKGEYVIVIGGRSLDPPRK
jgi:16S rRNA C1402 (ribose-2'-O) methylase RsmI